MAPGSLKDLYLDELCMLYDAVSLTILTLPRLAEAARYPALRDALIDCGAEARLHLERLDLIFTHWGETRHAKRCVGLAGIVQEADSRLNEPATDVAREAAIIGAAHRIGHYAIAAHGAARLHARWLNRLDDVRLLEETIEEESRADRRLTDLAEARSTIHAA